MGTDSIQGLYLQIVCSLHGVRHWYQLGITKEYTWTDCLLSSMLAGMNGFGPQCTEEESSKFSLCVLQKRRRSICKKQILFVCLWTKVQWINHRILPPKKCNHSFKTFWKSKDSKQWNWYFSLYQSEFQRSTVWWIKSKQCYPTPLSRSMLEDEQYCRSQAFNRWDTDFA